MKERERERGDSAVGFVGGQRGEGAAPKTNGEGGFDQLKEREIER